MYITGHCLTYCVDFGKFNLNSFLKGAQKNSYTLQPTEPNYKKHTSLSTAISIKIKFYMCIIDHHSSYYINFGMSRIYSSFTDYTKWHILRAISLKYLSNFIIVKLLESVPN